MLSFLCDAISHFHIKHRLCDIGVCVCVSLCWDRTTQSYASPSCGSNNKNNQTLYIERSVCGRRRTISRFAVVSPSVICLVSESIAARLEWWWITISSTSSEPLLYTRWVNWGWVGLGTGCGIELHLVAFGSRRNNVCIEEIICVWRDCDRWFEISEIEIMVNSC